MSRRASTPDPARPAGPQIEYLGHAGFIVEHCGVRVLVDPWFHPAFLSSWFPWPDNRFQQDRVRRGGFDYLYISHTHEDHFDVRTLDLLDRSTTVLVPAYRSGALGDGLRHLGFEQQVVVEHHESVQLADGFTVTMLLDTSHKEDSGVLFDLSGVRFLDLNDCNTALSELPADIDILAAQFSGAMWYPNCYDYPPDVMQAKTDAVRADLAATLARKVALTGARAYVPSAGPACFLDPALDRFNDRLTTIFPHWDDVADDFARSCPDVEVIRIVPGDQLQLEPPADDRAASWNVISTTHEAPPPGLDHYRERRRGEWEAFAALPDDAVTAAELHGYFAHLQRRNKRFLGDFTKDIALATPSGRWQVRLGRLAEDFVIETDRPLDPAYSLSVPASVLRAIVDGHVGWEEALLSMRLGLRRDPDVFDLTFMSLLRYGHQPAQTRQMINERENTETIEHDGLRMQRWCPHAGEDLNHAIVGADVVECPRHHWKWDIETGRCIEGGDIPLRVERIVRGADAVT